MVRPAGYQVNGVATDITSFICYPLIAKKDSYSWIGRMRMTMMAISFIFITCTFPVKQRPVFLVSR